MQIGDLNTNLSKQLKLIVEGGEPVPVTNYSKRWVTVLASDLHDELVEAAGARGQEILERYRSAAEQRNQEAVA